MRTQASWPTGQKTGGGAGRQACEQACRHAYLQHPVQLLQEVVCHTAARLAAQCTQHARSRRPRCQLGQYPARPRGAGQLAHLVLMAAGCESRRGGQWPNAQAAHCAAV